MKKIMVYSVVMFAAFCVILVGCRKNEEADNDVSAGEANAEAERISDDVMRNIGDAASTSIWLDHLGWQNNQGNCPTVSVMPADSTTWPKTVTIDFGPTNCNGWGNVPRRGKMIAVFTGKYRDAGTVISITFDNYYVNDNKVEGTKTITNMGFNSMGNMYFNIIVNNLTVTRTDGSVMTWNSTRTREWVQGYGTPQDKTDDVYHISGGGTGTTFKGFAFTVNIVQPLEVQRGCKWIKSGVIEVTPGNKPMRSIDFGNGNCDNQAVVTINGVQHTITLKG